MMKYMNRDFTYRGENFHLNDNPRKNEYECKYHVLYEYEPGVWHYLFGADTKKEAVHRVKTAYECHYHPYVD